MSKYNQSELEMQRQAQIQASYMTQGNPYTGLPNYEHPGHGYPISGNQIWPKRRDMPNPFNPQGESVMCTGLFVKGRECTVKSINPINQIDRLFALVYDALIKYNTDKELNLYWSFDTEYLHRLFADGNYDDGQYTTDSVYVYRNVSRDAVMATPLVKFVVSQDGLHIEGLSVNRAITKDDILTGIIPILNFIRDVTKEMVLQFDPNYDPLDDFDEPTPEPKKRVKKK